MNFGNDDDEITGDELNAPTKRSSMEPLPNLPDREWLKAIIAEVKYCPAVFNGQIQYLTRMVNGIEEDVLDVKTGKKIERREYRITYYLIDHVIPGTNKRRKAWLRIGASLGKKSFLRKYLIALGIAAKLIDDVPDDKLPTPNQIKKFLLDKHVWIQFAMQPVEKEGDEPVQRIVKDAIKPAQKKFVIPDLNDDQKPDPTFDIQTVKKEEVSDINNVFGDFAKPVEVPQSQEEAPVPGWDD